MARWRRALAAWSALLVLAAAQVQAEKSEQAPGVAKSTGAGLFQVSFDSKLDPIAINQIHSWVVHVRTDEGLPVDDAKISVVGGMPQHHHGMPTVPTATQYLGNGDYLVEGMKFHMNGQWQVTVTVDKLGRNDSVTFDLEL
ncbi:MAG: FixH family protein [Gammaproteobacteria bacterium]